ncbi:restriction endonuclease subunit S [Bacillus toyonensis]|uniref:restriction endonuclease subunit S n=1 Tax=Bacillus toyonensis TaxID=155322 RepID=UPI003D1F968B
MNNPKNMTSDKWKYKQLNEIANRITEKNGDRTDNVLTISARYGLVSQTDYFNKSVASKNLSGYYYLTKGDFAYNKSYSEGYPLGAIKKLERYNQGVVSTLYICFKLNSSFADSDFYKQYFESGLWNSEVRNIAQEGGRSHGLLNVGVKEFFEILVPVPPLAEQQKIASILSSVDAAIEKTEVIIEQTEKVKKGLMQQLLTKGVGHANFKKTEMGELPAEWEVVTLGSVAKVQGGYAFKSSDAKEEGIRWLKIANVGIGDIKWADTSFLPKEYEEEYNEYVLNENDIVMAMTRPILNNKLKVAVIKLSDIPALLNQRVCRFHLTSIIDREFFYQLARNSYFVKEIQLKIMGTDPPNVSSKQIEEIQIPLPPKAEQIQIANMLTEIDKKIDKEVQRIKYLQEIKQGLMQSLLTGKVRLKVDEAEVTQV